MTETTPFDPEVQHAWREDLARRIKEIDEGLVEPISWEQVRHEARERIGAMQRRESATQTGSRKDDPA
ncbi:MAG TPA: addiction module protein [Planctomycetaceae bacterium]|nr:addiction module protein [Planctomycetaceae bacterium]